MNTFEHIHIQRQTHSLSLSLTHTTTRARAYVRAPILTYVYVLIHTNSAWTYTHAHTHARTHARARARQAQSGGNNTKDYFYLLGFRLQSASNYIFTPLKGGNSALEVISQTVAFSLADTSGSTTPPPPRTPPHPRKKEERLLANEQNIQKLESPINLAIIRSIVRCFRVRGEVYEQFISTSRLFTSFYTLSRKGAISHI